MLARETYKAMNKPIRLLSVAAAMLALFSSVGCDKLRARDQLNKGVTAYKNAKYEEAIDHFQQSVALAPNYVNAKMYLAAALAQQYIPGVDTPDNNKNAEQAIEQYKNVLDMPNAPRDQRVNAAKGVASLLVPLGNVLTHATGNWHAVYAVGCGMNVVAALLGLFVLKPVIKARLAPPTQPATSEPAYADEDIGRRRAVG